MKYFRIIFVFVLLLLIMAGFCSCVCEPSSQDWYISSVGGYMEYANGQTLSALIRPTVWEADPHAVHGGMTYIDFNEDGTVIFKPMGREELHGTYTSENNGVRDTSFEVTFENGEMIENGLSIAGYGSFELDFEFGGVRYEFTADDDDSLSEEEYEAELKVRAQHIRDYKEKGYWCKDTIDASVKLAKNSALLMSNELDAPLDIYADGFKLVAVQITAENELVFLDAPMDGECVCVLIYNNTTPNRKIVGATLYYIDPLPADQPNGQ